MARKISLDTTICVSGSATLQNNVDQTTNINTNVKGESLPVYNILYFSQLLQSVSRIFMYAKDRISVPLSV
jgi:hypothetical protein